MRNYRVKLAFRTPSQWRWMPPECLAESKAREDEDDDLPQPSAKKQSKRTAAGPLFGIAPVK
jgi:hypothetical protein